MLETLCKDDPDNKRDYIYYLAIAYTRMKEYETAKNYVQAFLEIEPNNQQVMLIDVSDKTCILIKWIIKIKFCQEHIETEMRKEFKKDAAIAGGALLAFGALLGKINSFNSHLIC